MPKENQDGQEKTEQPTSRRKRKSRTDGNVARSQELNSFAVIFGGLAALVVFGGWMMDRMMVLSRAIFSQLSSFDFDHSNLGGYIAQAVSWLLLTVSPVMITVVVIGLAMSFSQVGFLWTAKPLQPKFSRLNPFANGGAGFKRLANLRALVTLGINLAKILSVGFVAYVIVRKAYPEFFPLMDTTVGGMFLYLVRTILDVAIWILSLLLILALLDFAFQKWKHHQDLKMTKDEVKDERKMSEGDPKVKQKIRQTQFQIAFNTMIKELPNADVIVTNPVHVAIALKYDSEVMEAPKVIGKGLRKLAERIKAIAAEHDIPIVENPPLARALYKYCDVGDEIPGQFYQDVAEILAYIYQLRDQSTPESTTV